MDAHVPFAARLRRLQRLVGRRVKRLREERSLTQQQLARQAGRGLNIATVLRIEDETHPHNPTLSTTLALADALGVEVTYLLRPESPAEILAFTSPTLYQILEICAHLSEDQRRTVLQFLLLLQAQAPPKDRA